MSGGSVPGPEQLRIFHLFKGYLDDPASTQALQDTLVSLSYAPGDIIFLEGKREQSMYLIVKGSVIISKLIDRATGREKQLALLRQGAVFGEMALFDKEPRSASARAAEPTELIRLDNEQFKSLLVSDIDAGSHMLSSIIQILNRRLRRTSQELVALYDTGKILGNAGSVQEMVEQILVRIVDAVGATFGCIFLHNQLTLETDLLTQCGYDPPLDLDGVDTASGVLGRVYGGGRAFFTNAFSAEDVSGETQQGFERECMIGVPIRKEGQVIGAMVIGKGAGSQPFQDGDLNLVQGVTNQVGTAIENAIRREEEQLRIAHAQRKMRI